MPPVPFKRAYFIFLNPCTACRFNQFFFITTKLRKRYKIQLVTLTIKSNLIY